MRRLAFLRHLLAGAAFGVALGLALVVVAPVAVGWRTMTVMSGSMAPTVDTGDAIVTRPVSAMTLRSGDVVTFRDPEGTGRLITHRVRTVEFKDAVVEVVTKGDANNATERWQVQRTGSVGRVVYRIPRIGYVLVPTGSPLGRLLLLAVPVTLLGVLGLLAIWRSPAGTPSPSGRPTAVTPPAGHVPHVLLLVPPGRARRHLSPFSRSVDDAT